MALFRYRAYDSAGAKLEGQLEAVNKTEALAALKKQGLLTSDISEVKASAGTGLFAQNKVAMKDIEFFTAELALLLTSGVRVDKGLDIIAKTKANPALAMLITDISHQLKKGASLTDALKSHPKVFEPLYCNLVQIGEAAGNLPEVFTELAKDLKFKQELQRKIVSSMVYPAVILFVCVASIFFIFNFIIPQMSSMFTDLDAVPWYTRAMILTSNWMVQYQWLLIAAVAIAIGFTTYSFRRPEVKRKWSELALRIPGVKTMVSLAERIRFCSSVAMMIKSGVNVDNALSMAVGNVKNHVLQREVEIANRKVKQGDGLTNSLSQVSLFPDFYVSLMEIGEQSGNLERVFDEITERSRDEFESLTQRMTTLIEPLLILFMATFIGGVVVTMLLSMVSVNDVAF
ncbi:type II secretion system F family protein [Aestuariibacter sp. AA17]|uniref:Type II secretion system F family protein n=1 Tax=Fluctibacter corallii TaxID=2984329 RepID=A0ABT3A3U9_9ALTE|nr:type II secretion system F family protein [Aestuariibacter sp. AA17]MCV2883295.1 type II secretion system F family protein [Aestuariibacter sp. AA17]